MCLEARLAEASVLDDVHVVKPGVLHATREIPAHLYPVTSRDEVVNTSQVDL